VHPMSHLLPQTTREYKDGYRYAGCPPTRCMPCTQVWTTAAACQTTVCGAISHFWKYALEQIILHIYACCRRQVRLTFPPISCTLHLMTITTPFIFRYLATSISPPAVSCSCFSFCILCYDSGLPTLAHSPSHLLLSSLRMWDSSLHVPSRGHGVRCMQIHTLPAAV
jgi:hypothetical protein